MCQRCPKKTGADPLSCRRQLSLANAGVHSVVPGLAFCIPHTLPLTTPTHSNHCVIIMPLLLSQVQLSFFLPFSFRPTTPTISILNPILLLPLSPFVPLNESLNARGIFSVIRCCAVTTNHDFWIQPALSHCQFNRICSI